MRRVRGTKIFITWGDHDLTENILHFVLARAPGFQPGLKGLSLFLVPKFTVTDGGALNAKNYFPASESSASSGIHASPTCTMLFDNAFAE